MKNLLVGAMALVLTGTAGADVLEEIVVTAQKREQNILEVPISIANKDGRELSALFDGGGDIRALSTQVPGLYIESSNGRVAPRFYIRGLGNIDFDLAASQPVSVVMDEVVMENVILKSFPIFDIDRVEVSRGPQGSLFGRNTTAGIVKLVTRKPTQETEGYVTARVGTLGTTNLEGAIGGGLGDTMSGRLSVLVQNRDDWINNAFTGQARALGGLKEQALRGQLLIEPTDNFDALVNVHMRSLDGTASVFRANILTTGSNSLNGNFDRDVVFFDEGSNNPQEYDSWGTSVKLDFAFEGMTLTSVTGYESADGRSLGDIDGGYGASFLPYMGPGFIPFNSQTQDSVDDLTQFTQELRLASDAGDRISWQTGVFLFDSDLTVTTNPFFVPATTVKHSNNAWALFGQGTMTLTEQWTLTAGLRYSDDEKDFTAPGFNVNLSDDQVSGDVSVMFAPSEIISFYGRWASGFKAPTIQGRDVAFFGAPSTATSETSDSFEVGFKSLLLDGRAQISGAIYTYEVKDMQFSAVGGATNSIQLVNAAKGTGQGFEIEGKLLVGDNASVSFGYAFNDTEIKDPNLRVGSCGSGQCTVLDPVDGLGFAFVDGNPFPNAPKQTMNVAGEVFFPFGNDAEIFGYADWGYQGETNIFLYESTEYQTDGQWELGMQIGYRKVNGDWEVSLFGRNVTDEENLQGGIDFNNNTGFVNEPRIFGVEFTARM